MEAGPCSVLTAARAHAERQDVRGAPSSRCLGRTAAITRPGTKEIKMRAYSLTELFNLTRSELFALYAGIAADLPALSETERETALENLRKLRRVLAHLRWASP
jgi:hypothetical protein